MSQHRGVRGSYGHLSDAMAGRASSELGPGRRTLAMDLPARAPDRCDAPVQAKLAVTGAGAAADDSVPAPGQAASSGARMPDAVSDRMARLFGRNFSAVRIHEGPEAQALGAAAYTQGTNIHFAPGQYDPHSPTGQQLLGHELAHVVQQSQGRVAATAQAKGVAMNADASLEREADEMGARAAAGSPVDEAARRSVGPENLSVAATGAVQCSLKVTGLASDTDVSTSDKLADAIIAKIGRNSRYVDTAAMHGAQLIRDTLRAMIDSAKDHGSFDLDKSLAVSKLCRAIEGELPLPVFVEHDVVQDTQAVGFVVRAEGEQVLVQWVRSLKAKEDSQSYLDEPPTLVSAREVKRSTARIVVETKRPRPPQGRSYAASEPAHGKAMREPTKNYAPSEVVSDEAAHRKLARSPEHSARVAPKDLSFFPTAMHMQFTADDAAGAAHIEQMALIGLREGFRVTVLLAASDQKAFEFRVSPEAQRNITVNLCTTPPTQWAEDSGEFHVDGTVHVPNRALNVGPRSPEDAIRQGREDRGFYLHPSDKNVSDISRIGADVASRSAQKDKIATGTADKASVFENHSYIEGGNMLTGTTANHRPFALIGMDALYATRKQIAPLRSGPASDSDIENVTRVVSQDIGIAVDSIHFVEQPGEFHLDMKMAVMGPGQVLLNDAFEVFDLQQEWILEDYEAKRASMGREDWEALYPTIDRELAQLSRKAQRGWAYESRTMANLLRIRGLKVVRVAANFPGTDSLPTMNFLNGEAGRGLDDSPFLVTNGGDPRAERYIADLYLVKLKAGLQRLYFLDAGYSQTSLVDSGGIGCRVKGQGTVHT